MKYILAVLLFSKLLFPQCSDAGICSVGDQVSDESAVSVGIDYIYGYSGKDDDVSFHSMLISMDYRIIEGTSIYGSIPFSHQTGPLGDVTGPGDLLLIIKQNIYNVDQLSIGIQAGVKLATGSDSKEDLPQIYQSGLGSNDILAGFLIGFYNFHFGAAYQLAGKRNTNILQLERGDDFMVRGGYNFQPADNISAGIEVLSINRLEKSTIVSGTNPGTYVEVPESNTSQVNVAANFSYSLSEKTDILFFGAVPLLNRTDNTDGLKRSISLSAGIRLKY